jgi:excisionase family DNA binding protein
MNTTIQLSLPEEQLQLLENVKDLVERQLALQSRALWLTEQEAAERLKVSKSTLRKWKDEGWLRYFAEGGNVRFRADYLDEDFEARTLVRASMQPLMVSARRRTA